MTNYQPQRRSIANRRSERVIEASLSMLEQGKVEFEIMAHGIYRIKREYVLYALTGYWRSLDGKASGYGVGALIFTVKAMQNVVRL